MFLSTGRFLIKPNNHELGEIFQTKLKTREDVGPLRAKASGGGGAQRARFHGR